MHKRKKTVQQNMEEEQNQKRLFSQLEQMREATCLWWSYRTN